MPAPSTARQRDQQPSEGPRTTYTDLESGSLSGNLTRDPDLRFVPDGRAVVTLRIAETERVKDAETGKWGDGATSFYDVVVWGDQATNCSDVLQRGDRVAAVGKWQKQEWTGDDGEDHSKVVLVARDIGPSLLFRCAWPDRGDKKAGTE